MSILQMAGIITGVAAALVVVWKVRRWAANIVEGLRSLLRNQMMNTYYKHKDEGSLRQYEMENFQKNIRGLQGAEREQFYRPDRRSGRQMGRKNIKEGKNYERRLFGNHR